MYVPNKVQSHVRVHLQQSRGACKMESLGARHGLKTMIYTKYRGRHRSLTAQLISFLFYIFILFV